MKDSDVISRGGVIAFRTDTFYGFGADPFNSKAVARIRELKGREDDKPILLLISDYDQVERLIVEPSESFKRAAAAFWPGPLTIIGAAVPALPDEVTAGTGTVGIRLPADEHVRGFVRECGGVLTATSANPSGKDPARSAAEVGGYFPNVGFDMIIDDGEAQVTEPSTVLDAVNFPPRIVREGAIKRDLIEQLFVST